MRTSAWSDEFVRLGGLAVAKLSLSCLVSCSVVSVCQLCGSSRASWGPWAPQLCCKAAKEPLKQALQVLQTCEAVSRASSCGGSEHEEVMAVAGTCSTFATEEEGRGQVGGVFVCLPDNRAHRKLRGFLVSSMRWMKGIPWCV